jgi:ketosteroid isomerase-like protein
MSRENVETVRAVYERWSQGDFRSPADLFDPLVLFVLSVGFPEAGTYVGLDRLAEYTRGLLSAWDRFSIEAEEVLADTDDSVVVAVVQRGVGGGSGAAAELRYFQVWSFRGPRVIRLEMVRDRGEALEAVGLRE